MNAFFPVTWPRDTCAVLCSVLSSFASSVQYEADSAPAMAIQKTIEQTKRRFDMYGKQGLYCGEDGLPHLVTSGDWNHAGEFMVSLANIPQNWWAFLR